MQVIVDANIFLAVILNEPEKQRIIEITKGIELVSPEVLPYEIGNALSAAYKKQRIIKEQAIQAYQIFDTIPVHLVDVNVKNALNIACDGNSYAYDAYYLELARKNDLPLLTLDNKMKNIAKLFNIKTIEL